jgi:hypothetical protein
MSDQLDPIMEETSQLNSVTTSSSHDYLEVTGNVEGSDVTSTEELESITSSLNTSADVTVTPTNDTVEHEIERVTDVPEQSYNKYLYDPTLKEYIESTFNTLTSLVNGISVGPENWILLLTKAMYVVSLVKTLNADKKIRLSVELVIRYLDDYTTLEDSVLVEIKSSVHSMCIAMLNNSGVLTSNVTQPAVIIGDPDVLATPLQITDLVVKKLINLVKSRGLDVQGVKGLFPELVVLCITTVEKYPHFTGLEKKNLVIQVIQHFLTEYMPFEMNVSSSEQHDLAVLSQSLPFLVDTLVNVGRGKVNYKFDFSNPETLSKLQLLGICLLSCLKRRPGTISA